MAETFAALTHYERVDYIRKAEKVTFFNENWEAIKVTLKAELERTDVYKNIPLLLLKALMGNECEHVKWYASMELARRIN